MPVMKSAHGIWSQVYKYMARGIDTLAVRINICILYSYSTYASIYTNETNHNIRRFLKHSLTIKFVEKKDYFQKKY